MANHLHPELANRHPWLSLVLGCLVAAVLAACGGGDSTTASPPAAVQPTTITGVDGASMDFASAEGLPAAALHITRADAGAPALPPGMQAAGAVYQFAPLGHVGSAVEIRVPFDGAQPSAMAPRLLVTLPGEGSWSEVDAQLEGTMLRARVPALGYAVAARPLSAAGTEREAASTAQPAQYLRGQLSAEPPLQGSGFLLTATAPSTATIRLDYSFAQSCAAPVQLRLRALVARSPLPSQPLWLRTVDLGSRTLTARAGSETFELPLTAADNGTWVFLADARCIEQGRATYGLLATLPVLRVKIEGSNPPPPAQGSATLGTAGGVVNGPDGVQLIVPAGALDADVTIRIARSAAGAPALPEGAPSDVVVYEVTPHDLRFGAPVTVRIPYAGTAEANTHALVATTAEGWATVPATFANGYAEIQRMSLSWYTFNGWTGICTGPAGDPYPRVCPTIGAGAVTTTPPGAISQISLGNNTVTQGFTQAATLSVPIFVGAERDCSNGSISVFRSVWDGLRRVNTRQRVLQQPVALVANPSRPDEVAGNFTFQTPVTAQDNGALTIDFFFECTRTFRNIQSRGYGYLYYVVRIDPPVAAPTITQQPANVAAAAGDVARFSVLATASAGVTVNWERSNDNGANWFLAGVGSSITGGSAFDLTTQLADNGAQFRARVCNGSGLTQTCLDSGSATLTVTQANLPPLFVAQPADLSILVGQTASFTVLASGRPAPSMRWQSAAAGTANFTDVTGETNCAPTAAPGSGPQTASTCTIAPPALGSSGQRFRAVATNAAATAGVASNMATLTISPAPVAASITQQPSPQTAAVGGSATFSVGTVGTAPLTLIWRLNGVDLPLLANGFGIGSCIGTFSPGAGTATLSGLSLGCNGATVTVFVSNGVGPGATSNPATLTVTPGRPSLTGLPTAQAVDIGQTATFAVQASGTNLTYQWSSARPGNVNVDTGEVDSYRLFEDIPGATASSYTTPPATIGDDQMLFAVLVCNGAAQPPTFPNCIAYGQVVSDAVRLTINAVVSQNFGTVASGTQATLNSVAFATPSIGVAVGEAGTILRTVNAGQTWALVASGTTANLRAVAFAPGATGRGVVTGENGLMFTADGGATWTATLPGDNGVCCIDVAYADAATVVASYRDGFLRSITAGQSFMQVFRTQVSGPVLRFGSATTGAAADGRILFTTDAGLNWSVATQPSTIGARTLAFANSNVAVASSGGALLRTTNGGQAWTALYGGGYTRYTNSLAFNGVGVGLAMGEGPSFSAMRTPNFGETWVPLALPGLSGLINSVAFADSNIAIAVGAGGTIVRFTAAGL